MALDIHNYQEPLVIDAIRRRIDENASDGRITEGLLEDIACVALNQLPARYVRHAVDTSFYLGVEEREQMNAAVERAVAHAFEYVTRHPPEQERGNTP